METGTRADVITALWKYIQTHSLQLSTDPAQFTPDKKLSEMVLFYLVLWLLDDCVVSRTQQIFLDVNALSCVGAPSRARHVGHPLYPALYLSPITFFLETSCAI